jgi:hypothetical protein
MQTFVWWFVQNFGHIITYMLILHPTSGAAKVPFMSHDCKVVTIAPKLRRQFTIDRHFFKKKKKQESLGKNQASATWYSNFAIFCHHTAKTHKHTVILSYRCSSFSQKFTKTLILSYHCSPFSGSRLQIHTQQICLCFFCYSFIIHQ